MAQQADKFGFPFQYPCTAPRFEDQSAPSCHAAESLTHAHYRVCARFFIPGVYTPPPSHNCSTRSGDLSKSTETLPPSHTLEHTQTCHACTHKHTNMQYTYTHAHARALTHAHMNIGARARTHAHTHTHTHTHSILQTWGAYLGSRPAVVFVSSCR